MFCKYCGSATALDAQFCVKCGRPVGQFAIQPETEAKPVKPPKPLWRKFLPVWIVLAIMAAIFTVTRGWTGPKKRSVAYIVTAANTGKEVEVYGTYGNESGQSKGFDQTTPFKFEFDDFHTGQKAWIVTLRRASEKIVHSFHLHKWRIKGTEAECGDQAGRHYVIG